MMIFNHPGEIHDEITKNMVISYPRNTEEEIAKRVIQFKRILKIAGIYPDPRDYPDNDAIMEALYEDIRNEFPDAPDTVIESLVEKRFEELPEPEDYDD